MENKKLESVKGLVEKITYKNENNGYTIAIIRSGKEKITIVGTLPFLNEGEAGEFFGEYIVHQTYGRQFSVKSFNKTAPTTVAGILKYLSSGVIKGVGPATAGRIVEKFGADSLNVIQNHPEELVVIQGISKQRAYQISEEYVKQFGLRDVVFALSEFDISLERCIKVYRALGSRAGELIRENPYILCSSGIEFPFELAETIAISYQLPASNINRIKSGIEYILRNNLKNGHTCLPWAKLLRVAQKLLGCEENLLEEACTELVNGFALRSKYIDNALYLSLPDYYVAEEYIAARLKAVLSLGDANSTIDELEIDYVENKLGIKFESLQRNAIKNAFRDGLLILTGGPGTGKTTTLNAIIELFEQRDMNIQLTAPTGRASKRMTELTGREAKTIHRLLEAEWTGNNERKFARNERNLLQCDVLIIDEASMVDTLLFESLLRAVRISCRIIIVGDSDQLPSVSAGNLLNDLVDSEMFPTVALKKVFRQAEQSAIIKNAHALIDGEKPDFSNKSSDFFLLNRSEEYDISNTVLELCTQRLPSAYGFNSVNDIQVICPSKILPCGTVNLNNLLQSALNPNLPHKPQYSYKGVYFREGDKVMQIKNNYDLQWVRTSNEIGCGVFNGDVGFITEIDKRAGTVKVQYDDKIATYFGENLSEIELAYAITVHKSQGSEFDCVVLPLSDIPTQLKYRNLLYTAVTRAKKLLVIVGKESIYFQMAANDRKTLRYTLLKEFLCEE